MRYTLEDKLERIDECSLEPRLHEVDRNLLHAYIACLTFEELCEAICRRIEARSGWHSAAACCGSSGFPTASMRNGSRGLSTRQRPSTRAITCFKRA